MAASVSLARQIAALAAEQPMIARRMRDAVARRAMRPAEMDYALESIEAAIRTLEWLQANEAVVRRVHAEIASGAEVTS